MLRQTKSLFCRAYVVQDRHKFKDTRTPILCDQPTTKISDVCQALQGTLAILIFNFVSLHYLMVERAYSI